MNNSLIKSNLSVIQNIKLYYKVYYNNNNYKKICIKKCSNK